jgi:hypothetical protein
MRGMKLRARCTEGRFHRVWRVCSSCTKFTTVTYIPNRNSEKVQMIVWYIVSQHQFTNNQYKRSSLGPVGPLLYEFRPGSAQFCRVV